MMPEGVALEYFLLCPKQSQNDSILLWTNAKNIFMQSPVIFPRVHVARNIRRFDRNPFDLIAMGGEQPSQTAFGVEPQQFASVRLIDKDRMAAASLVLGLDEMSAATPLVD